MRRLWIGFSLVLIVSFGVLGFVGARIYQEAPPIPDRVVTTEGRVVFDTGDIARGQDVWRGLEVVPLMFLGFDAWENWRHTRSTSWMRAYRWPIYFFIAVAFWNLVGAGLFGFMINPPIALYYMQGLNTTPVHGHTALFGVYGMLGMGLVLFTVKSLKPDLVWPDRLLKVAFWAINLGLGAMVVISVLPVGLLQTYAAVEHGYWYARSAEFLHSGAMDTLRWLRVIGDTIFALGAIAFVASVVVLTVRRRRAIADASSESTHAA